MYLPLLKNNSPSSLFNLISCEQWDDVAERVKYYPNEVKRKTRICSDGTNEMKVLPLHYACTLNPTVEATENLLRSYPKAARSKDSFFKRLPIHVACLNGASHDVIRQLLVVYKDGAKGKMQDGQIPLHYACGSGASKEVIVELMKAYPEGVMCKDNNGWLPIHLACLQNASVDVIRLLWEVYPESLYERTSRGNTPIQCLKSMKNRGTNREEVFEMLQNSILSSKRPIIRTKSFSQLDQLLPPITKNHRMPIRKRCETVEF